MTDTRQLTNLLRAELKLQTRHCQLLESQRRALIACDRPAFYALQDQYVALMEQLEAQAAARDAALRDADGNAVPLAALLDTLPGGPPPALAGLRDGLRATLERARALCLGSERLIQNELDYIAFSLDLFVEAGRRADVSYGGGGRVGRRKLLDRRA